jgi:hypothetical protein
MVPPCWTPIKECWKTLTTIDTCVQSAHVFIVPSWSGHTFPNAIVTQILNMVIRIGFSNVEEKDEMLVFETLLWLGRNVLHVCFGPFVAFLKF